MSTINITAREEELLVAVLEVMKAEINWQEVAAKANFTNAKQARDKWAALRVKLTGGKKKAVSDIGGEAAATDASATKKAAPRKRKAASEKPVATRKKTKNSGSSGAEGENVQIKPEEDGDEDGDLME